MRHLATDNDDLVVLNYEIISPTEIYTELLWVDRYVPSRVKTELGWLIVPEVLANQPTTGFTSEATIKIEPV